MTIVMGLDQHRGQITAEWIDTSAGEVSRRRVTPAHRAGVRRFLGRFGDQELEVALEATTGWRFVVEEPARIAAVPHLAEPAETAARRGTEKRAESDRADARHLREQVAVGPAMVDAVQAQMDPLDRELRAYARRQVGCLAPQAHYRIGPLTSVAILAELGDAGRFSSSRQAVRYAGMDIAVHQSDSRRAPGRLSRQGPPALRWALFEAARCARPIELTRSPLLRRGSGPTRRQPGLPGDRPQALEAQLPHPARAR